MSYRDPYGPRDPRDARTTRYEPSGRPDPTAYSRPADDPGTRAYSETYQQGYPQQGYPQQSYRDQSYPQQDPYAQQRRPKRPRRTPDVSPGIFAGGVVMTGVVTGLAAWLVAWIIRAITEKVNSVGKFGVWNPVAQDEFWFAVVGFLCALAAGALWYVLQLVTPSPDQFYRWIVALLIAAAVIIPLTLSVEWSVGLGTAVMHLVIGLPVLSLIPAMGQKSIQRH